VSDEALRRELAEVARALHARGWVANHDGNVSVRLDSGGFLATPTAVSKADVHPEMLVVLDADGKVVGGTRKVFSEFALHLAVFRARPDVRWVVHAHPPTATGWAVTGRSFFDPPFMAEPVVSLGARVPVVPFLAPGASVAPVGEAFAEVDAALLGGHGALT
jgi:L-fuculose-phosphate aldolase